MGHAGKGRAMKVMVVVAAFVAGISSASPAVAQTPGEDLPTCAPITMELLYPEGIHGPRADLPQDCEPFVYEMMFPLLRHVRVRDTFGDERENGARRHKGTDLFAPKLTPVVAVADGVVTTVHPQSVMVIIRHRDGWQSWYLHLNNDRHGTDDGLGAGIAPGIEPGVPVSAGQVIGWVGDSGNAEPSSPHLHFELHSPDGVAIDAAASLKAALDETDLPIFDGAFSDDDGLPVERFADALVSVGRLRGVDAGELLAPGLLLTGGMLGDMLTSALGYPVDPARYLTYAENLQGDPFVPPLGFDLAETLGCGTLVYCADQSITLDDLMTVLHGIVRESESVDAGILQEPSVEMFAESCELPGGLGMAGSAPMTRGDLVQVLARMLRLTPTFSCEMME